MYVENVTIDVVCVPGDEGLKVLGKLTAALVAAVIVATTVFWIAGEIDRRSAPTIEISAPRNNQSILVEIAGGVAEPGVFEMRQQDRVEDLIQEAGGLLPEADTSGINRAALLVDGQRVTIPVRSEGVAVEAPLASPGAELLLDINTATVAELDELPGIGEVRANAIVDYRNQFGPFQTVEELLFVEGISENLLDDLRPYITVGP